MRLQETPASTAVSDAVESQREDGPVGIVLGDLLDDFVAEQGELLAIELESQGSREVPAEERECELNDSRADRMDSLEAATATHTHCALCGVWRRGRYQASHLPFEPFLDQLLQLF
jgi:hypothetical protein